MKDFKNFTAHEVPEAGLEEYLETFIQSRRKDLEELRESFVKSDLENVKKILHKWEGYAEPYGFGGLRTFSTRFRTLMQLHKTELSVKICDDTKEYLDYKESTMLGQQKDN
ncbi:MAG: Hpt domain-containing protein [Bacteriovoracaceae bacterium]|nr:Hpt domain-containing protein [Bacteriovoracaceae bacterium]